ncbi:MAG: FtsX-like permease family protein [Spirosomataceae bacterium]
MNLFKISWKNLSDKRLNSFLSCLLMSLGITIISLLLLLNKQLDEQFKKNIRGIDMVVGAKGSPLQLILSAIYQIDSPTGNISLDEANFLSRNPLVKTAIPLSMGDNFKSFRIIGTNKKYLDHFEAKIAQGNLFEHPLDVVIGAKVAETTGLKLGDTFAGTHGYDDNGDVHHDKKYKVVGILDYSNSVADQVILTPLESVWSIHEHAAGAKPAMPMIGLEGVNADEKPADEGDEEKKEITAMLIKFRNPMGLIALPRQINANTKMQSALPSIEINRLFSLLGVGIDTLRFIALAIIIISGISVFVSLYNSLKERKYELALMLSMGATRLKLFLLLLLEGLIISVIGYVVGIVLSRIGMMALSSGVEKSFHYNLKTLSLLPEELLLLVGALIIGLIAAGIPSLGVYNINISRTLADE